MKILNYGLTILLAFALFISCDNSTSSAPEVPAVKAPQKASVITGDKTEINFNVTTGAGFKSASVSADNGEATITSQPDKGAQSGDVVVSFSAQNSGAYSIVLTITDMEDQTDDATAVVQVDDEQKTIKVTENITSDQTWEAGKTYILGGRIAVEAGATLTIEPGTLIKGEAGQGSSASTLLIARDATIQANGTADAPIIFTSIADEITPEMIANGNFQSPNLSPDQRGLWGGLIVLGNAHISVSQGSEAQIEGIPQTDTNGLYGGNDNSDSSGSLKYITIRHGGTNIGQGNEINGLSLGGVGNGTTVENIEIVANQDDGIEFFGGAVNVKNVLVWNNGDDAIDTDQAWAGTIDNMVLVNPGETAFELDGPEGSYTGSGHNITNASCYMANTSDELIDVDAETDVNMSNILFFGLPKNDDGTAGITMSSDYPEYASNSNGYSIESIEAIIPSSLTVEDYFSGGSDSKVTTVSSLSDATVGATDVSQFSFTWASQSGTLADIGLE